MPKHELQNLILRPLWARTVGKLALSIALVSGAGLLSGCGQKGDLRPASPKPPAQVSIAAFSSVISTVFTSSITVFN